MKIASTHGPSIMELAIERLHFLDLDVVVDEDETVDVVCRELATGLLVQYSVLIESGPAGGHPVVRFTGSRAQLARLAERYSGSPFAFDPGEAETVGEYARQISGARDDGQYGQ